MIRVVPEQSTMSALGHKQTCAARKAVSALPPKLSRQRCRSAESGNHSHLTMNQIDRQSGQAFILILGEAIFDRNVPTIDKTCIFQALKRRGQKLRSFA